MSRPDIVRKMTPGQLVNHLFTQADVARVCGVSRITVWRWAQEKPDGTGGRVPAAYHGAILELARAEKIELALEELHLGRTVSPYAAA